MLPVGAADLGKTEGNIKSESETNVARESSIFSKYNIVQNQIIIKRQIM